MCFLLFRKRARQVWGHGAAGPGRGLLRLDPQNKEDVPARSGTQLQVAALRGQALRLRHQGRRRHLHQHPRHLCQLPHHALHKRMPPSFLNYFSDSTSVLYKIYAYTKNHTKPTIFYTNYMMYEDDIITRVIRRIVFQSSCVDFLITN